jgi:pyroglutamyl-peptidase
MAMTALVTGFGPFPGAPFNPTGPLVKRLAHLRRPGLAGIKIIPYVFPTSYAAVDSELPKLIARYKPDMLLMFGLAPRARTVRVETRARNALVVAGCLRPVFGPTRDCTRCTLGNVSADSGASPARSLSCRAPAYGAVARCRPISL